VGGDPILQPKLHTRRSGSASELHHRSLRRGGFRKPTGPNAQQRIRSNPILPILWPPCMEIGAARAADHDLDAVGLLAGVGDLFRMNNPACSEERDRQRPDQRLSVGDHLERDRARAPRSSSDQGRLRVDGRRPARRTGARRRRWPVGVSGPDFWSSARCSRPGPVFAGLLPGADRLALFRPAASPRRPPWRHGSRQPHLRALPGCRTTGIGRDGPPSFAGMPPASTPPITSGRALSDCRLAMATGCELAAVRRLPLSTRKKSVASVNTLAGDAHPVQPGAKSYTIRYG